MFLKPQDLARSEIAAETVIVGAGAAGITLAKTLHERGHDVLLVEGGGFDVDPSAQALFDARSVGAPIRPLEGRFRMVGGTTDAWTGRCATLDPIDFETRSWVPESGWPISYSAVAQHYPAAAALIGRAGMLDVDPPWFDQLAQSPRPALVEPFLWRFFTDKRDTFRQFGDILHPIALAADGPRVLIEADLVGLGASPDGRRIETARLRARGGGDVRVTARNWILCCGGIENARLLLNFAEDEPVAFAAAAPAIGRWFMQHPRASNATIHATPAQADALQRRFNLFRRTGLHYEAGFALPAQGQRREHLLNASAVLRYDRQPASSWRRPDRRLAGMLQVVAGRTPRHHAPAISLHVDVEQVPDRDSRIFLQADRDAIGLRRAAIDWRIGPLDRRTGAVFTRAICEWIEALDLGKAQRVPDLDETGGFTDARILESYHHLGATRISSVPGKGVVDGDLKCHGLDNLFVCGGSVMPTGGHANPTLTIVALALRLANHLAGESAPA